MGTVEDVLEAIDAAMQRGDSETAVSLAAAAARAHATDAEVQAAYGDVLMAFGDAGDACAAYEVAASLEPKSAWVWADVASARLALADFDAARTAAERALKVEDDPEALDVLCRLAERDGDLKQADALARRAHALDEQAFPLPFRLREAEFRALVTRAVEEIPEDFQAALAGDVAILVEPVPPVELLTGQSPPLDPRILGLYEGVALPEREGLAGRSALPDRIFLFQHNLEHEASTRSELVEQIRITVFHEVGHYFGFSDEDLEERDFG